MPPGENTELKGHWDKGNQSSPTQTLLGQQTIKATEHAMHTLGSPVHTGQLCMDQKVKETYTHQAALPGTQSTLPGTQSFWSGNTLGPVCAHPDYGQPVKMVWHTVYTEATLSRVGDTESSGNTHRKSNKIPQMREQ